MGAILSAATDPFKAQGDGRFLVRASDIDVTPSAVLPLALVLNELCTNAVKYGALSSSAGRIEIDATVDGEHFLLKWAEKNGPTVEKPKRRGFGSTLIEHAFVAQLQGKARLDFHPAGVRYQLEAPLASMQP